MSTDTILILDSSDEESPPKKKIKPDKASNIKGTDEIQILEVKSLANNVKKENSEILVIEDDDLLICNETLNGHSNGKDKDTDSVKTEEETVKEINDLKISDDSENNSVSDKSENNLSPRPSTSKLIENEISSEFKAFLEACQNCSCAEKYKAVIIKRIPLISEKYSKANSDFVKSKHFNKLLLKHIDQIKLKPSNAIMSFNDIFRELMARRHKDVELTEKESVYVKKLTKTLKQLDKKIKKLETTEVDLDEDENSAYIMLDRYRERFCQVHKKLCTYIKENIHAGRTMYSNLDFSASNYSVINKAIDKLYTKKKEFPTHYEVDKCIRKCVKKHDLSINEDNLKLEIKKVFTELGKLLQRRRKNELHDTLSDFIETSVDPATNDPELQRTLEKQLQIGEERIEAVLQKYTDRQENGEPVEKENEEKKSEDEHSSQSSDTSDT